MDKCKDCQSPVARSEIICSNCASSNIERKEDSKWLFTIRNENDLKVLTDDIKRILLILADYPNFAQQDYETLRFQAFEIWNNSNRHIRFKEIMTNYYHQIYLVNKSKNPKQTPAPQNFWPYKYQFYLCNPILTFSCLVSQASTNPQMIINHYIDPQQNRSNIKSIMMPIKLLNKEEKLLVTDYLQLDDSQKLPEFIDEKTRQILSLRKVTIGNSSQKEYLRYSATKQNKK